MDTYYDILTKCEWSKKRPPLPYNVTEFFQDCATTSKLRKLFVTLTAYLNHLHRERLYKRVTPAAGSTTNGGDSSSEETTTRSSSGNKEMKLLSGGGGSGTLIDGLVYQARLNIIPEELMNCESHYVCAVVAAFCVKHNKDQFAVNLIYALLEKAIKVGRVENFVKILKDTPKKLKSDVERVKGSAAELALSREQVNVVVRSMLIASDVLREKNYAKLAMAMDAEQYVAILTSLRIFRTINPYEPLITHYIVECVALKDHEGTKQRLCRQFKVNPIDTMDKIIAKIPPFASKREKRDAKKQNVSGRQHFDDKKEYFIYKSRENFTKDIAYMSREINGEGCYLLTYNDCVFDVLGGSTTRKNWQERLDMAPQDCTKICIQRVSGEELNNINENATVGISWFDDESGEVRYIVETFSKKRGSGAMTTTNGIADGNVLTNNISAANMTDDNGSDCGNNNNKYCDVKPPAAKRFKSRLTSFESVDK